MSDFLRDELIQTAEVVVVKVGTNVLSQCDGLLNTRRISHFAEELSHIRRRNRRVILVSSGAVGAGMGRLGLEQRPVLLPQLQAVAAIGQSHLIEAYEDALNRYGIHVAQVLLTADDLSVRRRYLNARNAIRAMLDYGAIPIINENDTISVRELHTTFGDNDRLASLVAGLFENPLLILLTDVDGLYDRNPDEPQARLIPVVDQWTPELMSFVDDHASQRSRGGMSSKINAARIVNESGGNMIIANGETPNVLSRIFAGEPIGTVFLASDRLLKARKRWLGFAVRPTGSVYVDAGAKTAVLEKGRSLLPIGVTNCVGSFEKGDLVSLVDREGKEFARGMSNYRIEDLLAIRGRKSDEFETILGRRSYEEAVHRDNMQILYH